jgi:hypothetical protein
LLPKVKALLPAAQNRSHTPGRTVICSNHAFTSTVMWPAFDDAPLGWMFCIWKSPGKSRQTGWGRAICLKERRGVIRLNLPLDARAEAILTHEPRDRVSTGQVIDGI